MTCWYFYDLPVYRLLEERYYAERQVHVDQIVFQIGTRDESWHRARERRDPRANDDIRHHLQTTYGGAWRFNEVIGYVRLHFFGRQVRGEYFAVAR